ncbi:MAG: hypothetical protein AAGI66_00015 [Cyanobacteria bacterium P01_H01_bin.74]
MPTTIPVMPFVFLALFFLPIKLGKKELMLLACGIWMVGGLIMTLRGIDFIAGYTLAENMTLVLISIALALIIGGAKGKFVLSKTCKRNIDRLNALTEKKRPLSVYSIRSWVMISIMVMIAVLLNVIGVPPLLRGSINLGIGASLIVSAFIYIPALRNHPAQV